jgi:DTW domain-containing protein
MGLSVIPRPICYSCFRPEGLCYCDVLRTIQNRTRIVIVQHPRETFHPLNTVRIAEGCLQNVQVLRRSVEELDSALARIQLPPRSALLFPSADAIDLEDLSPAERPDCLVVLDGTWHHARTLKRDSERLAALPKVRFTPPAPSEYRIRREPQADYLSTVESIAHALHCLEPETPGIDHLRHGFRTLIERAIDARGRAPSLGRSKRPRPRTRREPAPALTMTPSHLVTVYAEASAHEAGSSKAPLIITARRQHPSDAPPLRWVLQTPSAPHPRLLEHLAIEAHELQQALSQEQMREQWNSTLQPGDLVVSWSHSTLALLAQAGLDAPSACYLKELYCNHQARRGVSVRGALLDHLQNAGIRMSLPDGQHPAGGRALQRLRETEAMLHWMREEADDEQP